MQNVFTMEPVVRSISPHQPSPIEGQLYNHELLYKEPNLTKGKLKK